MFFFFFFNGTATTEIYTLSLHDALPIWVGIGGKGEATVLKENPLVATAIAQHTPQTLPDASTAENADAYQGAGIQAHAVIPVLFRDEVVAIISCQWPKTQVFSEAQLNLFTIAARQVGLTLACCG